MSALSFTKMHGLGNDFVVFDFRDGQHGTLSPEAIRAIADRRFGVGCDQLIVIEKPHDASAGGFMRIYNADGGEVGACGNASRCVGALLMRESEKKSVLIETVSGILEASLLNNGQVAVDMGAPRLNWQEIPLARAMDTLHAELTAGPLHDPVCTSMGNPHATFFVEDAAAIDLEKFGPVLEHDPLFPERANIGVAQILGQDRLRFRVWERGAGVTAACGTGACAALVGAARRGLTGRGATVVLDGGELEIEWLGNGHVLMTGPAATSFTGVLDPSFLAN